MVLLPDSLKALKRVAKQVGLDFRGAYLNLDGGFDSARNRKYMFNTGLIPNIPENPRNRKRTKRGRQRLFNAAIHALRMRVERTFAWEDKFKRLLLRFERIQQRHYGMKLLAYTLINLRAFCGVYNSQPVIKDSREKTALLTQRQAFIPGVNVWAFCLQNSVNGLG
jgi:hypothetical protein